MATDGLHSSHASRPLRIGIIGAGLMGYWHARTARHLGSRVVRVADPVLGRAEALTRGWSGAVATTNSAAILERDLIDIVHICSPLPTHVRLAKIAINAGIHALVEKPLTASGDEALALLDAACRADVILCPVHQICFQNGVSRARRSLGHLGEVSHVSFNICSAGGGVRSDRTLDDVVVSILPHPLSVLSAMWPEVSLETKHWSVDRSRVGELLVSGRHAGASLSILVSMHARPTCFEMIIRCNSGTIRLDLFHGFATTHGGRVSRFRKAAQPFADAANIFTAAAGNLCRRSLERELAYPGLRNLVRQFYAAVTKTQPPPISKEEILGVAFACDGLTAQMRAPGLSVPLASPY